MSEQGASCHAQESYQEAAGSEDQMKKLLRSLADGRREKEETDSVRASRVKERRH